MSRLLVLGLRMKYLFYSGVVHLRGTYKTNESPCLTSARLTKTLGLECMSSDPVLP